MHRHWCRSARRLFSEAQQVELANYVQHPGTLIVETKNALFMLCYFFMLMFLLALLTLPIVLCLCKDTIDRKGFLKSGNAGREIFFFSSIASSSKNDVATDKIIATDKNQRQGLSSRLF
jgi:hypothetical protein